MRTAGLIDRDSTRSSTKYNKNKICFEVPITINMQHAYISQLREDPFLYGYMLVIFSVRLLYVYSLIRLACPSVLDPISSVPCGCVPL